MYLNSTERQTFKGYRSICKLIFERKVFYSFNALFVTHKRTVPTHSSQASAHARYYVIHNCDKCSVYVGLILLNKFKFYSICKRFAMLSLVQTTFSRLHKISF